MESTLTGTFLVEKKNCLEHQEKRALRGGYVRRYIRGRRPAQLQTSISTRCRAVAEVTSTRLYDQKFRSIEIYRIHYHRRKKKKRKESEYFKINPT